MAGFIDVHTHILPGVDDGASNLEESIALIKMARENGTQGIILTPHYRGEYKKNSPKVFKEKFKLLKEEVEKQNIDVDLYLGCEIHYEVDVAKLIYDKKVLSINNSMYALLEFSTFSSKEKIIDGVAELMEYGFVPIIAHIERYEEVRKDISVVDELLSMGALIQINADSVLGRTGFSIKRFCNKLLKQNKVHFVGSDGHNLIARRPLLKDAYNKVCKKCGIEYANKVFNNNAAYVLKNKEI